MRERAFTRIYDLVSGCVASMIAAEKDFCARQTNRDAFNRDANRDL
jgi:hypothetical protein